MNTDFATAVYRVLALVPTGRVTTYRELARAAAYPRACRAVGTVLKRNPKAPVLPCHRIVRSDGRLGGYVGGAAAKAGLLAREGVHTSQGRIVDFDIKFFRFDL